MAGVTRGEPTRLAAFTAPALARVSRVDPPLSTYSAALARLTSAPSDLAVGTPDRSGRIADDLTMLRTVDRQPQLVAAALTLADRLAFAPAGNGPFDGLLDAIRRALEMMDPEALAAAVAHGEELAERFAALIDPDAFPFEHIDNVYDDLAGVLAELDAAGPVALAAFWSTVEPSEVLHVLGLVHDGVERSDDYYNDLYRDRDGMTELLQPLAESFSRAAAMGVLSPAFVEELTYGATASTAADGRPDPTLLLSQLLLFGDPMNAGDPAVTAALASMVLRDGYVQRVSRLTGIVSPFVAGEGLDRVWFDVELETFGAMRALADHPEAAYQFMLDPADQRSLLNRAGEDGWWIGAGGPLAHLPSSVVEAGLLHHPLEIDGFGDTAYLSAMRSLITEVAGRGSIGAPIARGLGVVLAPHYDSVRAATADLESEVAKFDVLGLERLQVRAYLRNVAYHSIGLAALEQVYAGWSAAVFAQVADDVLPDAPRLHAMSIASLGNTGSLTATYRLLLDGLADANVTYEDQQWLLFASLDRGTALARSRALRIASLPGGPVGFAIKEAAGWASGQATSWTKDRILDAGPPDVADLQAALAQQMPLRAVEVALSVVPDDQLAELVPVLPGPRPVSVTRDKSVWERITFWSQPELETTVMVEFHDWPREVLAGWIDENQAALGLPDVHQGREREWWIATIVKDVWKGFAEVPGG